MHILSKRVRKKQGFRIIAAQCNATERSTEFDWTQSTVETLLGFVEPNCRAVFVKSAALGADVHACASILVHPVQPRCLLSLAAHFPALQRARRPSIE